MNKEFGKHYLVEFIECDAEKIKYINDVKEIFLSAAVKSRARIVDQSFSQFNPYGVSGVIHIAESHFSIHTWPEDSYAAFDVFTCGEMDAEVAIEELKNSFQAKRVEVKVFSRGY